MTKPLRFAREARQELLEAARWYEQQLPGLREEFLASVDEAIERITLAGSHLGSVPQVDAALGIKRVFMRRFPYALVFVELPTRIRILAVAHQRRRPMYWRARL